MVLFLLYHRHGGGLLLVSCRYLSIIYHLSSIFYQLASIVSDGDFEQNDTPGTVVKKLCINTEKKGNKKFDMEGL